MEVWREKERERERERVINKGYTYTKRACV